MTAPSGHPRESTVEILGISDLEFKAEASLPLHGQQSRSLSFWASYTISALKGRRRGKVWEAILEQLEPFGAQVRGQIVTVMFPPGLARLATKSIG